MVGRRSKDLLHPYSLGVGWGVDVGQVPAMVLGEYSTHCFPVDWLCYLQFSSVFKLLVWE